MSSPDRFCVVSPVNEENELSVWPRGEVISYHPMCLSARAMFGLGRVSRLTLT
jgi:hypothetical protein